LNLRPSGYELVEVQLLTATSPCKRGHLDDPALACGRAPKCALDYQARISGPRFDRIDMHVEVPAVQAADLTLPPPRAQAIRRAAGSFHRATRRRAGHLGSSAFSS